MSTNAYPLQWPAGRKRTEPGRQENGRRWLGRGIVRSAFDTAWQRAQVAWGESGKARFTFHDLRAMSNDRHETGDHLGNTPATRAKHYERRAKVVTPASFK